MNLGQNVIAQAWSMTKEKEIPYLIKREGKPGNEGGTGYKWRCSCPSSTFRKTTCKHILALRESAKYGLISNDKRFNLSDLGREVLKVAL